jgi:hypothetical protein
MTQQTRAPDTLSERLFQLDERVRALQDTAARGAAMTLDGQARLEASQTAMAKALGEHGTAQAVMTQWMRDWTAEVTAWRQSVDRRMSGLERRQDEMARGAERARGAARVAMWVFGTALTLVTSVFSGVLIRLLGEIVSRSAH